MGISESLKRRREGGRQLTSSLSNNLSLSFGPLAILLAADQGEQVECDHKYDECYKAYIDCYKDKDTKERVLFRGCGGYATVGENVVGGEGSLYYSYLVQGMT